ncbi:hypothetical protein G7078_00820 [Sphingomonas sinipercae]|uniref:Secreted protein n=1 Tax=Sphingomonas sinipercae TaxID=2714944 RepID=A0A6G7ZKL0_9SPHN|nr:hypothetical protein [Sphingomonas sinipercae]QIL01472.1 hypothetical protein G7078_00820 [Sphingomonas sinipercae]
MKLIKIAAASALLCSTMMSPANAAVTLISSTPSANPAELTTANLAAAQSQCDTAAATADADGSAANSDRYTAAVVQGAPSYVSGPAEIGSEADRTLTTAKSPAGTFSPGVKFISGNPYRNGGSVNMFGLQKATGGSYSNSQYDFTAQFKTTYAVAYTCTISKEVYNPPVYVPPVFHPRTGHWIVNPDFHGNEEAVTQNCTAFNTSLPTGPQNGHPTDQANCRYIEETAAYTTPGYTIPAYFGPKTEVAAGVPGGSFNQEQTDTLSAHESFGSGYSISETVTLGQVVVCISPSKSGAKLPGAWTKQNGYTGDLCNSAWYNGTSPYSPSNYAGTNIPNLNDSSHNWVTVPII